MAAWVSWGQETCTQCHEEGKKIDPTAGAHAAVSCGTCHEKHEEYPHAANLAKPVCANCHVDVAGEHANGVHGLARARGDEGAPDCGTCHGSAHEALKPRTQAFRGAVPATCGMCHDEVAKQYVSSVHGRALEQGIPQAPLCTDCHGDHAIQKHTISTSPVNAGHIRETCGRCHGDLRLARKFGLPADRVLSFDASFHGLAAKGGSQTVANCASCHGVHNILPSSDKNSTVNAANLPTTCGHCHAGAGERFAIGSVHLPEGRDESAALRWVRQFYIVAIPLVIGLMLLHNGGDWVRKAIRMRFSAHPPAVFEREDEIRMLGFERVQHALLGSSFIILAWTGFALKYPDQFWAVPLTMWEKSWPVRSYVHRGAAIVFTVVSIMHLASLIVSPELRRHWMSLLPRRADITEGSRRFLYNLGVLSAPPPRSPHSYVEKAEYWAVVWGAAVMILSGAMLFANNLVMRWWPKEALDIATSVHYYEAVLATLAIVVWHFYFAIFDPDVYPMDTAWLTGKSKKKSK